MNAGLEIVAKDRVLEVTLVNPPDNRVTEEMMLELGEALDRLDSKDLDLLVIRGNGTVFSKGIDLSALTSREDPLELRKLFVLANGLYSRIARSRKPVIAAINGACLGGGLELALACHFRLCSAKSRLGVPEVWLGLVPGLGGFYRLCGLIGKAKALEMAALGDLITAEEALRLGVVNRVFPREKFNDYVNSFISALLMADRQVILELIRLALCSTAIGEEDNIRQGMESFNRLAASWSPKSPN